jgi:hypothetical protein
MRPVAGGWLLVDELAGHAFVSYVREDSGRVDRLQAVLAGAGVRVWRDTAQLWPGQDWRAEIHRAITAGSLAFIACFSDAASSRDITYQDQELALAVEQMQLRAPGRPWLIPLRFAPCEIPDLDLGTDRTLSSLQRVDLFDGSWERGIPPLLRVVLGVLQDRSSDSGELIARSGLGTAQLTEFLQAAAGTGDTVSPLLQRLARRQVASLAMFLRQLPGGADIVYDGEDRDWLLGLTAEAQRSINAISIATTSPGGPSLDSGLWVSDLGARYLDRQREAVGRGVTIRRILVFENQEIARDEAFLKIAQMHHDIGGDVRILHHQRIPEWLQWVVSDFVIFDSAIIYEATIHSGSIKPAIVRTLLSTTPARVRHLEKQFDQLWHAADQDQRA